MIDKAEFGPALAGRAFAPGSAAYDQARAGQGLNDMPAPDVAVMAESVQDVIAAVTYARQRGAPVQIVATGHNFGYPFQQGVLINTSRLKGVVVDAASRTARIAAGTTWKEVVAATQGAGLVPLSGSSPTVGAVGYTVFGGVGGLVRKYGVAADSVRSFDVVTAEGRLRHVDATNEPDLFWALRGGGGNFGVVTQMEIELYPHPTVYAGNIFFPMERAAEVATAYSAWAATLPDEMTSMLLLLQTPPLPTMPESLRGRKLVGVRGIWLGDVATADALLQPIRALEGKVVDTFATLPYAELNKVYLDPERPGHNWRRSALLRDLGPQTIAALVAVGGADSPSPLTLLEIRQLGGQMARVPIDATAYSQRTMPFVYNAIAIAMGRPDESTEFLAQYPAKLQQTLEPFTQGLLPGWLGDGAFGVAQTRQGFAPANYERLTALKAHYDPTNMFRLTHNIPPVGGDPAHA